MAYLKWQTLLFVIFTKENPQLLSTSKFRREADRFPSFKYSIDAFLRTHSFWREWNWQIWTLNAHLIYRCSMELGKAVFQPTLEHFLFPSWFYFKLLLCILPATKASNCLPQRKVRIFFFWRVVRSFSLPNPISGPKQYPHLACNIYTSLPSTHLPCSNHWVNFFFIQNPFGEWSFASG